MKRLLTTLVILTGLIGSGGTLWGQDVSKGLKAAQSGDYATALKEWKPLAEQGYANAQHNLGYMYRSGKASYRIRLRLICGSTSRRQTGIRMLKKIGYRSG